MFSAPERRPDAHPPTGASSDPGPAGRTPHNVPAALSGFVGRAHDLAGVGALLGRARLVTLAGPGGVGKTRLAREAVHAAAGSGAAPGPEAGGPAFPDGVWWVELAPLPPGVDPAPAAAAALGVRQPPGADHPGALADTVAAALAGRRLLVVLDNCEHVVEGAAALADALLRRCPGLAMLATSREALGVEGEVVWPVAGLAHPPRPDAAAAALAALAAPADAPAAAFARAVAGYEAVELFVERARAVQPGFALTARTAPAVAAVTARLDGQPLALELAAAQVGTLGVDQLATRLDDVFAVLTRGRRTALPRHRTLRAMLDWSYHLLAPSERALLAQLAVFRGPFGLDAVEAVGRVPAAGASGALVGGAGEVLTAFGRLVEQSLVEVRAEARDDAGETRYRLLETVRQFGLARLAEDPAAGRAARARHARWVAARAGAAGPRTWSAERGRLVRALERDVDEVRAALAWAAGPEGDAMTGVRIAGALAWFWYSGVPWGEARALTAAALAAADREGIPDAARPPEARAALADLLYPMSGLAYFAGEAERMLALGERALALWDAVDAARAADPAVDRALGGRAVRGRAIMRQQDGLARLMRGEVERALADADAAVRVAHDGGEAWLHAVLLMRRALVAAGAGRIEQAMADYAAAVPRLRAVGEAWFLSLALEGMAAVELTRGNLAAATAHARESVAVLRDEPDPWFVSRSLDTLAAIAVAGARGAAAGRALGQTAARLLGAAAALRERCGAEVIGPDRERYAATVAAARAALGADYAAARGAGAAIDLAGAFALAASADVAPAGPAPRDAPPAARAPAPRAPADESAPVAPPCGQVAPAPPSVEVLTFGPLLVARGGAAVPPTELTPAKVRELLLYLALHPGGRTKEQAALALWPDASPAQVRNAFHVTLHQLRRALGHKDAVTFDGGAYALARAAGHGEAADAGADGVAAGGGSPDGASPRVGSRDGGAVVRCDVDAVLAAAAAVRAADRAAEQGAARGPGAVAAAGADAGLLDGWRRALDRARRGALGEGEDAGEWLAAPRARVAAAWADAMEALARLHARRGTPREAAAVLEALVAAEPLREGAHRALMACYVGTGEPARALAHYDALAALLAREVGAAPGRETRAVAEAIRGGGRPA